MANRKLQSGIAINVIGKAIAYTLTLWDNLIVYVQDGRLQPDINAVENAVREP